MSAIVCATCRYPVYRFNLLAASHNFRAASRDSSRVSKYNRRRQAGHLSVYQSIRVTNLIIIINVSLEVENGHRTKNLKMAFDFPKQQ